MQVIDQSHVVFGDRKYFRCLSVRPSVHKVIGTSRATGEDGDNARCPIEFRRWCVPIVPLAGVCARLEEHARRQRCTWNINGGGPERESVMSRRGIAAKKSANKRGSFSYLNWATVNGILISFIRLLCCLFVGGV